MQEQVIDGGTPAGKTVIKGEKKPRKQPVLAYSVYVLDRELLRYIDECVYQAGDRVEGDMVEGRPELGTLEEAREVEAAFRNLFRNPRGQDETIRKLFGVQAIGMEEAIELELEKKRDNDDSAERVAVKAAAASLLYSRGYYQKLADISAECADDAMALASGRVIPHWRCEKSRNYRIADVNLRNAGSYDIICRFGKPFLKMSLGYIDLEAQAYASELV